MKLGLVIDFDSQEEKEKITKVIEHFKSLLFSEIKIDEKKVTLYPFSPSKVDPCLWTKDKKQLLYVASILFEIRAGNVKAETPISEMEEKETVKMFKVL